MDGKWIARNERNVYDSEFVKVDLYDVELPDGKTIEHHIVRAGKGGAGTVVYVADKGVLLLWRHRITGDAWGWEIPGGRIDDGETPQQAAERETFEETGWRPRNLKPLLVSQPMNGVVDHPFHFFYATEAEWDGPAPDATEAADISWVPVPQVLEIMQKGEMNDGFSLMPLLWAMQFGVIPR